ncbi:MAG: hypothetical protein ACYCV0_15230 [Desulfitobacteriaceae bacterium]
MGLGPMILLEALVLLCAGMTFVAGIRGTVAAVALLTGINLFVHEGPDFWRWELPLLLGAFLGILVLILLSRKANRSNIVSGFVGGIVSLVVFAAFITPIVAVLIWVLIFGTGLIPAQNRKQVLWGLAPSVWRLLLSAALIVYGNFLTF